MIFLRIEQIGNEKRRKEREMRYEKNEEEPHTPAVNSIESILSPMIVQSLWKSFVESDHLSSILGLRGSKLRGRYCGIDSMRRCRVAIVSDTGIGSGPKGLEMEREG